MPSAMAPLDTISSSRPSRASAAIWRHQSPMAAASSPRPSLVTRLEPTLTTMRRAVRSTPGSFIDSLVADRAEAFIGQVGVAWPRRGHVIEDGLYQRLESFARQCRDL